MLGSQVQLLTLINQKSMVERLHRRDALQRLPAQHPHQQVPASFIQTAEIIVVEIDEAFTVFLDDLSGLLSFEERLFEETG